MARTSRKFTAGCGKLRFDGSWSDPYRSVGFMAATHSSARQRILQAALDHFANGGYAGTSVQEIVDAAGVAKPTLYYYFGSKAGLYQALVDSAHDERFALMQEAAGRSQTLGGQLGEILACLFEYARRHQELTRLCLVSAFAAPGELPPEVDCLRKGMRNFAFVESLIQQGQARGELDLFFSSWDLAMCIYGQLNIYVMWQLLKPRKVINRKTAQRIAQLFLFGAAQKNPALAGQI